MQEHQCQFIFRFAALDLGAVATGFALLRLPKMAEVSTSSLSLLHSVIDLLYVRKRLEVVACVASRRKRYATRTY